MALIDTEIYRRTLRATLHRPEKRNAVNFQVMEELEHLLDRLEEDESLRAFVLQGSGDTFISGGDLREFHTLKTAEEARPMAERMHRLLLRLERLPCWTIASVNGAAYGGGCEIMLAFDFRLASRKATFGFTQGKFYLPPGWGGLTRLVEQVGRSVAMRWLAECAVVEVPEALESGLIERAVPREELRQAGLAWCGELTRNDRDYINALKKGARNAVPERRERLREELDAFGQFWEHEKHHERVRKFLERRKSD